MEVVEMMQQRQWVRFDSLFQETNKSNGLKFYANAAFSSENSYTSYVKGKYVDFSYYYKFSSLSSTPEACIISVYRDKHHHIKDTMGKYVLDAFCKPMVEWVM